MANINSDLIQLRTVNRCDTEGAERQFAATVKIPAGTTIAQNDTLSLAFLGAYHAITEIRVFTDDLDDGTTMVWDVGYTKMSPGTGYAGTNSSGDAIDYGVDTGTTGVSPASDTNYFVSGATFGRAAGWSSLTINTDDTGDPDGLAGPVRIVATQTASTPTQTTASASDRIVKFLIKITRNARVPAFVDRGGYA